MKLRRETLDIVVIGGIYGIGKRRNFVGSYLLALRDENNEFKSVALVGTCLDDATLEYLTGRMKELEISTKGSEITVEQDSLLSKTSVRKKVRWMPILLKDCFQCIRQAISQAET